MHQQLWGYKVEENLYVGVREQKRLNTTGLYEPLQTEVTDPNGIEMFMSCFSL
jgi:hypothetical protein